MKYDIFLVGVGGQGILTIGELLASAAFEKQLPVNFFPYKGMAQRGGLVKAQLRLGAETTGPNLPERSADLVIAMERSEALRGIRYLKPGGDFLLYPEVWAPTAVLLGKAPYPALEDVCSQIQQAGARLWVLDPTTLPEEGGKPAAANLYILGAALRHTTLGSVFSKAEVEAVVSRRWQKNTATNNRALQAGWETTLLPALHTPVEAAR